MHCENNSPCDNIATAVFFFFDFPASVPESKAQAARSKMKSDDEALLPNRKAWVLLERWPQNLKGCTERRRFKEGKYIYAGQARQEGGWENSITDDVFQLNNRVKYRSWPPFIWLEILRDCSHVIHLRHASSNIRNQRTNPVQFSQLKSNRFHLNISLDHLNVSTNRFTCYYGVVLHTIQTRVWLLWLETCLYPTFCSFLPSNV